MCVYQTHRRGADAVAPRAVLAPFRAGALAPRADAVAPRAVLATETRAG